MAELFDSINLQMSPDRVKEVNFDELVGQMPDLVDWDNTFKRISVLHTRFYGYDNDVYSGSLQNINNYFVEVVNWLQGKTPLTNFVGLPQISTWKSLDQNTFSQFQQGWVPNMESTINNDQTVLMLDQVNSQIKKRMSKLGSIKVDSDITKVVESFSQKVDEREKNIQKFIDKEKQLAVNAIEGASALREWVKYYSVVENDYTVLIEGSHKFVRRKREVITDKAGNKHTINKFPFGIGRRNLEGETSIKGFKLGEARKRFAWFCILFIVVAIPSLLSIFGGSEVFGIHNPFYVDTSDTNKEITAQLLEKIKFLPIVIITVFGYAFSNKNYRILSNLREQYRHRRTVAMTLQGIIVDIDETGNNKDIRARLVDVGAKAMFELKTIGHLTKKDSESGPMSEIVQTIMPGK